MTKTLDFYFFSCIMKTEIRTDVLKTKRTPPYMTQERMLKMERTYVLNFIFKVLVVCGVLAAISVAGLSDSDVLSTAEVFIYGGTAFFAACLGVWGTSNCTRAIEAEKLRRKRETARLRRAAACKTAA